MEHTTFCSEKFTDFAKAMMEVHKALEPVLKTTDNKFTGSKYAPLPKVFEACRKPLHDNNIYLSQYTLPSDPGSIYLVTRLFHIPSEQFQESHLIMPAPRNDPQAYGSALTYCRRYSLQVAVGIVCEDDDDGNKAGQALTGKTAEGTGAPAQAPATGQRAGRKPPEKGNTPPQTVPDVPEVVIKALDSQPALNGVRYEVELKKGKYYIVARGNTRSREKMLHGAGFQKGTKENVWFKLAEAA